MSHISNWNPNVCRPDVFLPPRWKNRFPCCIHPFLPVFGGFIYSLGCGAKRDAGAAADTPRALPEAQLYSQERAANYPPLVKLPPERNYWKSQIWDPPPPSVISLEPPTFRFHSIQSYLKELYLMSYLLVYSQDSFFPHGLCANPSWSVALSYRRQRRHHIPPRSHSLVS